MDIVIVVIVGIFCAITGGQTLLVEGTFTIVWPFGRLIGRLVSLDIVQLSCDLEDGTHRCGDPQPLGPFSTDEWSAVISHLPIMRSFREVAVAATIAAALT